MDSDKQGRWKRHPINKAAAGLIYQTALFIRIRGTFRAGFPQMLMPHRTTAACIAIVAWQATWPTTRPSAPPRCSCGAGLNRTTVGSSGERFVALQWRRHVASTRLMYDEEKLQVFLARSEKALRLWVVSARGGGNRCWWRTLQGEEVKEAPPPSCLGSCKNGVGQSIRRIGKHGEQTDSQATIQNL